MHTLLQASPDVLPLPQLTMLMLPHPFLILSTPYHAYAPTVRYGYVSDPTTPCLPSPILMLLHPRLILSSPYHAYTPTVPYRYVSDTTPPCASVPLPHPLPSLQYLCSCSTLEFSQLSILTLTLCLASS
ncbi:hypothetical protein O181_011780 [Austropuccinia psidii MF-1]|uniref:Uncharacterized protein n=1 Tax=Austropuccinia psidii MF-1 TaxID=1389203 RepID=A0A9Q3BWK1_9BASI|nr:hypothetical protein [Austropuccinia psidii MF-1]